MAIDNVSATTQTSNQTPSAAAAPQSASSDFTTFLKLLTTQLQNQDPLKPLESTEFVAQLASFSAVEQQVKTNDALSVIQELLGGTSTTGLSNWIGNQVRVLKDASFDGAPIDVYVAPYEGADQARLVVRNSAGETVQSIALPLQTDVFQWAGVLDTGDPLPAGDYGLTVESLLDGEVIDGHQASVYEDVREARFEAGEIVLVFSDGTEMPATSVTAVRQSNH